VALQVAQLRERLVARVQLALERLAGVVHGAVRPHVAALREGLAAELAGVGALARVTALVRLEVAELREGLRAAGVAAGLGRG
jgi:hypothetical protein